MKLLIIILVCLMSFSGYVDIFPIVNDYSVTLNDYRSDVASDWILEHTPKESVFLTTSYLYHPALLVGRKTYLDYGYFNWSLGYNEAHRRAMLPELFSQMPRDEICRLLAEEQIDYVSVHSQSDFGSVDAASSTIVRSFDAGQVVLGDYTIYDVSANCE